MTQVLMTVLKVSEPRSKLVSLPVRLHREIHCEFGRGLLHFSPAISLFSHPTERDGSAERTLKISIKFGIYKNRSHY